jgi:hypothetical protein
MHTIESAAITQSGNLLTCGTHTRCRVSGNPLSKRSRNLNIRDRRCQPPRHPRTGQDHHPGIHRNIHRIGIPPPQLLLHRITHLREHEISVLLPRRQRPQGRRDSHPPRRRPGEHAILRAPPSLLDHRPDRQITRPPARTRLIAVDEQELAHPVRSSGKQIPPEPQQITVPRVQARDTPPAHRTDLMRHRDTRHRRPPNVVVRNQESVSHRAQDSDLMTHMPKIRTGRRLDLADNLKRANAHTATLDPTPRPSRAQPRQPHGVSPHRSPWPRSVRRRRTRRGPTGSAPSARSMLALSGERVVPATVCPSLISSGTSRVPMTPLAPAMKRRTIVSL